MSRPHEAGSASSAISRCNGAHSRAISLALACLEESLGRVLPDDVEHVVARVVTDPIKDDQALIDQRTHAFERGPDFYHGSADLLDVAQAPATCEYGETTEEFLRSRSK